MENPDGDELDYRLAFREENEAVWRPLGGPDPLTKTDYDWNTEGLPDGTLRRARHPPATIARSRASGRSSSTFMSAPILVDNRKPEVVGLVARYPFVSGRARDDQSPLTALEFAVDGGEWQQLVARPTASATISSRRSAVKLPALAPGPHAVTVRAWDSADNVGAGGAHGEGQANDAPSADDHALGLPPAPAVVQIEVGLLQNFCEILYCPDTREAAIVDPAWEVDRLLREVAAARPAGHDRAHHPHPQRSHRGGRRAGARRRAPRSS